MGTSRGGGEPSFVIWGTNDSMTESSKSALLSLCGNEENSRQCNGALKEKRR